MPRVLVPAGQLETIMFAGKPIIGLVGGIGSGKSFVAALFGELGCAVIDSDAHVRAAYDDPAVRQTLRDWWGERVFHSDGTVNRAAVAGIVFTDSHQRAKLESLIHPLVADQRQRDMEKLAKDPGVVAFVWDTPLLLEAGLRDQCDAMVYVDAPADVRASRVRRQRGWDEQELGRRENLQWPLDKKRQMSDDVVNSTADADGVRRQVRAIFSRILSQQSQKPGSGR